IKRMKSFTQKSELFWTYVLFMLWPLFAVVRGFKNIGQAYARTIIILFFGLFGLHLVFDLSDDSSRHEASFLRITQMPFSEFFNIVSGLYSDEGQKPDFVMDLIGFVVSRLTSDSSIYFMALGLVLGWVVVKNMSILYELYLQKKTTIGLIFVIFFIFMMGPVRLLSFRHYLGLAVYVLAIYQYLKGGKNYYLLLIVSSVFMHFAFLMVVPLFF